MRARERKKNDRQNSCKRKFREHFTTDSYWKALQSGFKTAHKRGIELDRWFPYQLRHSRATYLRKQFGVEASRVTLGHSRIDTTELYAERDLMLAVEIAKEVG